MGVTVEPHWIHAFPGFSLSNPAVFVASSAAIRETQKVMSHCKKHRVTVRERNVPDGPAQSSDGPLDDGPALSSADLVDLTSSRSEDE